jgi:hypothetical protein
MGSRASVGILTTHGLTEAFFTTTSMIGFVASAGIIIRNSIILVNFIGVVDELHVYSRRTSPGRRSDGIAPPVPPPPDHQASPASRRR